MRAEVFLGIFPLIVVFKMSAQGKLPRVGYSTAFDKYAITSQRLFMAIVGGCVGTSLIGVFTTWREVRECLPGDSDEVLSSSDRDYTIVIRQIEKVIMGVLALYWVGYNVLFALNAWRVQRMDSSEVVKTSMPLQLQTPQFIEALDAAPGNARYSVADVTPQLPSPATPSTPHFRGSSMFDRTPASRHSRGEMSFALGSSSAGSDSISVFAMQETIAQRCTFRTGQESEQSEEYVTKRRSQRLRHSVGADSWFGLQQLFKRGPSAHFIDVPSSVAE